MFGAAFALEEVILPDSITNIDDFAFHACTSLQYVTVPVSVTSFGGNSIFSLCENVVIRVYSRSAAHTYAKNRSLDYEFITSPGIVPAFGSGVIINRETGYISGLVQGLFDLNGFIEPSGGAVLSLKNSGGISCGTGSRLFVDLPAEKTGGINTSPRLETYYVVIYGDTNGDSIIDGNDSGTIVDFSNWLINWEGEDDAPKYLAGDINGDGNVDSVDADLLVEVENRNMYIDQYSGLATMY